MSDKQYTPELGQAVFGRVYHDKSVPNYVHAALRLLSEIVNVQCMNQGVYSPFDNTGNKLEFGPLRIHAYDWSEDSEQTWNLKYKDFEVSWYKYLGRGMSMPWVPTPDEMARLLDEMVDCALGSGDELL